MLGRLADQLPARPRQVSKVLDLLGLTNVAAPVELDATAWPWPARAVAELMRMVRGWRKPEVADAAPGVEVQDDVDTLQRLATVPVDAEEHAIEDGSAEPEPRGGAVEQQDVTLAAGTGDGTGVLAPTKHPPPRPDAAEPAPAVLELAEHESRRCPPDESAPSLTQASSEDPVRAHQARLRGLGLVSPAQAPLPTRHRGGGQAWWGRAPPTPPGHALMGPRNRGPPPRPRQ